VLVAIGLTDLLARDRESEREREKKNRRAKKGTKIANGRGNDEKGERVCWGLSSLQFAQARQRQQNKNPFKKTLTALVPMPH